MVGPWTATLNLVIALLRDLEDDSLLFGSGANVSPALASGAPPSPAPGAGWTVSTPKVLFISSPRPSISAMNEPVDFLFYIGIPAIPQDTLVEPVVRSQLVCPLWRETAKDLEAQLRF